MKNPIRWVREGFGIVDGGVPGRPEAKDVEGERAFDEFLANHRAKFEGLLDLEQPTDMQALKDVFMKMNQGETRFEGRQAEIYAVIVGPAPETPPPSAAPEAAAPPAPEDEDASGTGTEMDIAV